MINIKLRDIKSILNMEIKPKGSLKKKNHSNKDYNFFAPYIKSEKTGKNKTLYKIVISAVLLFLFTTTFIWNFIQINNTKKDIEKMNKIINAPESKAILAEGKELSNKYNILKKYYDGVSIIRGNIDKKSIIGSNLIREISSAIPQSVSFKSITINEDKIQIQGLGESRVNIAEFQHNLKELEEIKDVQVMTINENSNSEANLGYNFTLKCTLKDVGENEN